jgi:YD repeat-containing protein
VNAFEVDLAWGTPVLVQTDMYLPGDPPIAFTRVIEGSGDRDRRFNIPLANEYDTFPTGDRFPYTHLSLHLADRMRIPFQRISGGTGYADAIYEQRMTRSRLFYHALVGWNGNGWDLDLPEGRTLVFPEAYYARRPQQGALVGLIEPSGASLVLNRDADGNLQTVRAADGRWIRLRYQGALIASLQDSAGEKADYSYDSRNFLVSSANTEGETFSYSYNRWGELAAVLTEKTGKNAVMVDYNARGWITSLRVGGGPTYSFASDIRPNQRFMEIVLRDNNGGRWTVQLDACTLYGCTYEIQRPRPTGARRP